MGLSALLRHGVGAGLIVADAALHGLAVSAVSAVGLAIMISGALTLMHGASLANRLSEWWFASAFDGTAVAAAQRDDGC
jgi:hypothetical protein